MEPAADRSMDGFSKGMRQRSKVAAALVKNPLVLVLDEPLNGADPVQRLRLIDLFRRLGAEGRTVIVSSHVLNEVESMADRVIVVVRGRLAAAGGHRAIRDAMDDVPRHVLVRALDGRRLASALLGNDVVSGINVDGDDLIISTTRAKELAVLLPQAARDLGRAPHRGPPARRLAREPVPGARAMTEAVTHGPSAARRSSRSSSTRCSACLPGKRWVGALIPAAAAVLFGFIASTVDDTAARAFAGVAADALFGLVMPVTCLVIGDAVLGAEVRSGTFTFTWMSPVPTWQIAVGPLARRDASPPRRCSRSRSPSRPSWPATPRAPGRSRSRPCSGPRPTSPSSSPSACITKRAAVWSLAFVFLVERLLGASPHRHRPALPVLGGAGRVHRAQRRPATSSARASPTAPRALVRLCIISAVALVLTSTKLRSLKLTGSSD